MELHGIRPELQPSAIAQTSQSASQEALNELVVEQTLNTNHDAPGIDEVDTSAITGLGGSLNIIA